MRHLLAFSFLFVSCLLAMGQENEAITKRLEEKYGWACYHDIDGGFYTIVQGRYDTNHKSGNEGICDSKGREIIPPIYDETNFNGTYCKVYKKGYVGIRDLNNKELLPCTKYTDVLWFQKEVYKGMCEVAIGEKRGVIDKDNKEIIPCQYDKVDLSDLTWLDYCEVTLNGKVGVADRRGKTIIPCRYDKIGLLSDLQYCGYCEVTLNGKVGVVDKKGKELMPCGKYDYFILLSKCHIFLVSKGTELNYNQYGSVEEITKNGKWGMFDLTTGTEIVPCKYDYIGSEADGLHAFNMGGRMVDGKKRKMEGGKWGYLDTTGKEVVPAQYEDASSFKDGVAQVKKDGVVSILEHPLKGTSLKVAHGNSIAVDTNIPKTDRVNDNAFAFVIANENYAHLSGADFSINDGKVFAEYCKKTLGIPEKNVRYYEDATYGNIVNAIKKLQDIADVYDGEASIIFYFSGLGATDATSQERYLMATDASLAALQGTGYSVSELLNVLNGLQTTYTWVILDAPFSNVDKTGKSLAEARGAAIRPKASTPHGNVVVSLATGGVQPAYSSRQHGHSLFTYALLEKIQQTKGNCTLKEVSDHAAQWVKNTSLQSFDKAQEATTSVSETLVNKWQNIKP